MRYKFDWDQWNRQKSYLKHGVTNLEAESVFNDPDLKIDDDTKHSLEEERYICVGRSIFGRLIVNAYTVRDGYIRIISSRPANRKDKDKYDGN